MAALRAFWAKNLLNKLLVVGLVGLVCCCPLSLAGRGQPTAQAPAGDAPAPAEPTSTEGPPPTAGPTETPAPTDTPAPTETPAPPTATPEPAAALDAGIRAALGDGNRDVARVAAISYDGANLEVTWAINDNLTEGMIKTGAKIDIKDILQAVVASGAPVAEVLVRGSFPLTDAFGVTEERQVVSARYTAATLGRIDFSGFNHDNVYAISDNAIVHPAFQD